ncbi:MAG TPA: hypothetical protein VGC85_10000, partial [Chthoniobacterales bacterium]
AAAVRNISVNANAHENRRLWRGGGDSGAIRTKKYRPPRPMDVKGGCSPQNNLPKLRKGYASLPFLATNISQSGPILKH